MSNYYRDQQRAFNALHETLQTATINKQNINVPLLIYEMVRNHPVSPKALRKQIDLFIESRNLVFEGDEIVF